MKNLINKFHNLNFFIKILIILSFIPLYFLNDFNESYMQNELITTSTAYVIFAFILFWMELQMVKNIFIDKNSDKKVLFNNYIALEKLGDLKDRGILTEKEFNEQKKKLLNQ